MDSEAFKVDTDNMPPNPAFQLTVASALRWLAIPSSLGSSAAAESDR